MIDFRFFIISIVAVFLALGVGIVVGSGFLRDPILTVLENRVDDVLAREDELRSELLDIEDTRDFQRDFLEIIEPSVVDQALAGDQIVMIEVEGSDDSLTSGLQQVVEEAGGTITLHMRLDDKLALDDEQAIDQLATILDTVSPDPNELRTELGLQLGEALAQAATPPARLDSNRDRSQARAREMLERLEQDGFLSLLDDGLTDVPQQARFLLAAGAVGEPSWQVEETVEPLSLQASSNGELAAVVAESRDSGWAVTQAVRDDAETSDVVSTVDNAETFPGRITTVLGLSLAPTTIGHWGSDEGAVAPAPTPPS